jgi:anti-anti-sigma factor
VSELGRVSIEHRDHIVVGKVDGELDLSNAEQVREALTAAVDKDDTALVLDLSATTYFDSAGVRLVFQLADDLRARRRALALVLGDNQIVQRVASLSGIGDHVACHPTVAAAVESLSRES